MAPYFFKAWKEAKGGMFEGDQGRGRRVQT